MKKDTIYVVDEETKNLEMINFFDTNNLKIESKPCSLQPEDYDGAGH